MNVPLNDLAGLLSAAAANGHYEVRTAPSLSETEDEPKGSVRPSQGQDGPEDDGAPQEDHSQGSGTTVQRQTPMEALADKLRIQAINASRR